MSPQRNSATRDRLDGDLLGPLTPRSLIASLLLRSDPPRMRGARLVQWCALFGVPPGTTRVALSRMTDRGELVAVDGSYELTGPIGRRRPAQDWALRPELGDWDGTWRVGIVEGGPRDAGRRRDLRDAMRRLRHVEVREGVWTRPDNLPRVAAPNDAWAVATEQCGWWSARPDDDVAARATTLFDAGGWSARADRLARRLATANERLERSVVPDHVLADAFEVGTAALAHVRNDPLLPAELVTRPSAGGSLRAAYGRYERAFTRALRAWFRAQS